MKKFLIAILSVVMVLSAMSVATFAEEYIPAARSLDIYTDTSSVEAGDTVTVTVVINGDDISNIEWDLKWKPELFKLLTIADYNAAPVTVTNESGYLSKEHHFLIDASVFPNGAVIKTYTFEALAQDTEVTGEFLILNQTSYTDYESIKPVDTTTDTNGIAEVTITLIEYDVQIKVDGNVVTGNSLNIPFNDEEHSFVVTTEPTAKDITYKVNGVETDEVVIKDKGSYTIECIITPEKGYKSEPITFVFTVEAPVFEVEVTENYVEDYSLVLVYTDIDNVWFKYGQYTMTDVSASSYIFDELNGSTYEHKHVYGFVVDGIDGGSLEDYKSNITDVYEATDLKTIAAYDVDINNHGDGADSRDIRSVYIVFNSLPEYFVDDEFMIQILKSDINNDRYADGIDANIVKEAVYPTQTL